MVRLTLFIIIFSQSVFAQVANDSVAKWAKIFNLVPLDKIDTTSKLIPKNIVTSSGWHIDHYARNGIYDIELYTFIYNDKVWYDFHEFKKHNHGQITYDSIKIFKENNDFLYLKFKSSLKTDSSEAVFVFPKKQADDFYQFYGLLYADYINNIFIEYDPEYCGFSNILYLKATHLNNNKSAAIKFTKGVCNGGINNWCIDSVSYMDGILIITAKLTDKRTKKPIIEVKKLDL